MLTSVDPDPLQPCTTLWVGRDAAGHWLVQESGGRLEGRFVSYAAAMAFARSARLAFPGAVVEVANGPMVPLVPFRPVQPWEMAQRRAA